MAMLIEAGGFEFVVCFTPRDAKVAESFVDSVLGYYGLTNCFAFCEKGMCLCARAAKKIRFDECERAFLAQAFAKPRELWRNHFINFLGKQEGQYAMKCQRLRS